MQEWRLYARLVRHWREAGFLAAASVSDPRGRRMELDVVAFTADLSDVRVTEAKARATGALVRQCLDRLAFAPRVYAAVPAGEEARLLSLAREGDAGALGVLAVHERGVEVVREARPVAEARDGPRAGALERVLAGLVADGVGRA